MSQAATVDALVVGAGPVGLTMAAELTRYGVRCRIIDRNAARSDHSKALVLWPRSLELLDTAGAVEPFLGAGLRVLRARLYGNGQPLAELTFEGVQSPFPFALMLPQSETERLLEAHLLELGVAVERRTELSGLSAAADAVAARLRGPDGEEELLSAAWLLGCDGAHSSVRHELGIDFAGASELNDWILADVHVAGATAPDELRIYFHAQGLLALFPIGGTDRFRVIADGGPAAPTASPHDPTLAEVQAVVDARGPGGLTLHDPVWLAGFRINERKVDDYRAGRIFLAGDAAHIHSPAGGQGMNTGMQDAFNLGWKLGLVHAGRARATLLDSYNRERGAVGDFVLRNAAGMTRVATLRNPTAQHLRNALLPALASLGFIHGTLRDTLAEMNVNYRRGPLSVDERPLAQRARVLAGSAVAAGDRAPDVAVTDARSGAATRLFALLRNRRHCLLLCAGDAAPAPLHDVAAAVQAAYPQLLDAFIVAPADAPGATPVLLDPRSALRDAYGVRTPTAVVIRPDGYVGYYGQPVERGRLLQYLATYLL